VCGSRKQALALAHLCKQNGITSAVLHGKLSATVKKELVNLFGTLKRGDADSALRVFIWTPAMVGGVESWGYFDVALNVVNGLTLSATALLQAICRTRDAKEVVHVFGNVRLYDLPAWKSTAIDKAAAYQRPEVEAWVKAHLVKDATSLERAVGRLRMQTFLRDPAVTGAVDPFFVATSRGLYVLQREATKPLQSEAAVRNASDHFGRAARSARQALIGGTAAELNLSQHINTTAFESARPAIDKLEDELLLRPQVETASLTRTLITQFRELLDRNGCVIVEKFEDIDETLTAEDRQILDSYKRAKKTYANEEIIRLAHFALNRFLPLGAEHPGEGAEIRRPLYSSQDDLWEAMLALFTPQKPRAKQLAAPATVPAPAAALLTAPAAALLAAPSGAPAGAPTAATAPPARPRRRVAAEAAATAETGNIATQDGEAPAGSADGDIDGDSDDDGVDLPFDDADPDCVEFQKRIWPMTASFGKAAVEDIARRVLQFEHPGPVGAAADGSDDERPVNPIEAWQHMEDFRFQRCFVYLAERKLAIRENTLTAWTQKVSMKFACETNTSLKPNQKPEESFAVKAAVELLCALGYKDIEDERGLPGIGELADGDTPSAQRYEVAQKIQAACMGMLPQIKYSGNKKGLMKDVIAALRHLDVCGVELKTKGKRSHAGSSLRFISRPETLRNYLDDDFASDMCDVEGQTWRKLWSPRFWTMVKTTGSPFEDGQD
jgi:hypothetical protein